MIFEVPFNQEILWYDSVICDTKYILGCPCWVFADVQVVGSDGLFTPCPSCSLEQEFREISGLWLTPSCFYSQKHGTQVMSRLPPPFQTSHFCFEWRPVPSAEGSWKRRKEETKIRVSLPKCWVWVCLVFPNTWIPRFWRKRTPVLGIRHPTTGRVTEWTLPGSLLHSLDTLHVPDAYWQSWSEIWYLCCHLSEQGTQHAAWDKEWEDSWVRLTWGTSWMNGWKTGAKAIKPQPRWTEATSSPAQPCSSLALGIVQSA